jgi:hypothetical protein
MAKKTTRRTSSRTSSSVSVTSSAARQPEFNPDYTHVKRDLSRIGVLAGSFFALLIVLSFFIK